MRANVVVSVVLITWLVGCGDDAPRVDAAVDTGGSCVGDDSCDDGQFCTGRERCEPGAADADSRGCVSSRGVPCLDDQLCNESADVCETDCPVNPDADGDGAAAIDCGGNDCDDSDPTRHPDATEVCDSGHDEDCDVTTVGQRDRDRDGFNDALCINRVGAEERTGEDCDDLRAATSPVGTETCNGLDDDCDGAVDEGTLLAGFDDTDGDLHGDPAAPRMACPGVGRFAILGDDCDDSSPVRHPAQVEICDGVDNDCDGRIDEGAVPVAWYPDADGDGFGRATEPSAIRVQCAPLAGHSILPTDCDDTLGSVRPGALEACNGLDDDCNGIADFTIGINDREDDDGDGFVDIGCGAFGDDCDDGDASVHNGAAELCDLRDNDCDGVVDEMPVEAQWFLDRDGDGRGEIGGAPIVACEPQPGRVLVADDCDDGRTERRPGAVELCNGLDDDCDGVVDEDSGARALFLDADGDGGGTGTPVLACEPRAGYVEQPGDCDDDDPAAAAGRAERCNGADDDCDGTLDEDAANACGGGASGSCVAGACVIDACIAPFLDCDAAPGTGCEVDPRSDPLHCGSCDPCPPRPGATAACADSMCALTCNAGLDDCDGVLTNGCERDVSSDVENCGACARRCTPRENADARCMSATCTIACRAGYASCDLDTANGCETWLDGDAANCGRCGRACPTGDVCALGDCFEPPFDRTLATTAFEPTTDTVLSAGAHYFTRITIPAGVTVRVDGTGVLELYATGDVIIDGAIDVSGGDGGAPGCPATCDSTNGYNGGGGATGTTIDGATGMVGVCNVGGGGGTGMAGGNGSETPCATGGLRGGGAGGTYAGSSGSGRYAGGGGGGYAGGGGASGQGGMRGGDGGSIAGLGSGGAGGVRAGGTGAIGGDASLGAPYAGQSASDLYYAGGGGSIGAAAAADLDVSDTFYPGSGGGGGGGTCCGGSGGGGGGGALRIVSLTRIVIDGAVRADGGATDSLGLAGGGGGSGGVIVISTPELTVTGAVSAAGGATRGAQRGGAGGLGRVRISTIPARCALDGVFAPTLASGCAVTPGAGTAGRTYVGLWPL